VATREAGFPPPGLGFGSIARAAGATTRRRRRSRRGAAAKNATPAGSAPERPRRTGRKTSHPLPFRCCRGPCTPSTPPNTTTTTKQHQTPTPPPNNNTNHRERDGNGQANDQTSKQARKPAQNHEDGRCGVARCGAGDREPHERAPNPRTERRRRARRHAHRSWVDRPDCRVRRRPTQEQTRRGAVVRSIRSVIEEGANAPVWSDPGGGIDGSHDPPFVHNAHGTVECSMREASLHRGANNGKLEHTSITN